MISPTRNELLANVVEYIALATGLAKNTIIRGKQNAPSPTAPYCSVLYLTDTDDGLSNIDIAVIDGDERHYDYNLRQKRYYTLSVQFYRGSASDLARTLMIFHQLPAGKEFIQTALFSVRRIVDVSEAAAVMSQNFEERAALNFELVLNTFATQVVNNVESVTIPLTFEGDSNISETIEVVDE
jgi:hypothetical protein